jgi:hypothetical protein
MNDRLFHAVSDDSLKEEVLSNGALPLVKELNHAYGLKVFRKSTNNGYAGFLMCNEEGFAIAKVFFHDDAFCYHAPYQQKSRGSDQFDRQTFRSKKLSTLMSTLKRSNIVTTTDRALTHYKRQFENLITKVSNSFEDKSKDSLPPIHAQKLLQAIVEGKDMNSFPQADRDLYLQILDNYKNVDTMKVVKKEGIESMFSDCHLVLADGDGQYLISESSYVYEPSPYYQGVRLKIKPTTPFKRVKNLTDYPSVISTLTMLKVHLGDDFRPYAGGTSNCLVPLGDRHIPDLEVVYGYESRHGDFDMGYLCLSK